MCMQAHMHIQTHIYIYCTYTNVYLLVTEFCDCMSQSSGVFPWLSHKAQFGAETGTKIRPALSVATKHREANPTSTCTGNLHVITFQKHIK